LPNLLAQKMLVPELIQAAASAENICAAALALLNNKDNNASLMKEFVAIHESLKCNAGDRAAQAVLEVVAG
jgi:lipid-A-disaccharide synthase